MTGFDLTSSEIGHWNLDLHHTYNFQEGTIKLAIFSIFLLFKIMHPAQALNFPDTILSFNGFSKGMFMFISKEHP